jgi:predicted ester cyclase
MMRYKGGKVVEVWHYGDDAAVMAQLGVKLPAA